MTMQALSFQNTQFDIVDHHGQPWLQATQIAQALGYAKEDAVSRIYRRNAGEFTPCMTETVNLTVSGNLQKEVRIFSLRGAHLLAMFARTEVAAEFRRWVLDVLDHQPAVPAPSLTHRRWMIYFDHDGKECVKPIPENAFIGTPEDLLKAMTMPNGLPMPADQLFEFVIAATQQLRHRSAWRDEQLKKARAKNKP